MFENNEYSVAVAVAELFWPCLVTGCNLLVVGRFLKGILFLKDILSWLILEMTHG